MISVGSVFSGAVDGMSMGFMQAGYNVQIANEIDKTAIKTASINYKHKIIQSDIRDISCEEYKGLRPFTVREYARLMGIPDTFEFANERTTNFKHIGNSVSPVITRALAEGIKGYFM